MKAVEVSRAIAKDVLHMCRTTNSSGLSTEAKNALADLDLVGFSKIENFVSLERCAQLRSEIDRLLADGRIHVWRDELNADKRVFGADRVSAEIRGFYQDPFVKSVINAHEKSENFSGFTMAARIDYVENNKGSGQGWHRDRADYKQTKAILYLTDVDADSGPFSYIEGSHRARSVWLDSWRAGFSPMSTRISDQEVQTFIERTKLKSHEFVGPAGTLFLVNTRGIHRGKPLQLGRHRYAMTNYYWFDSEIPSHIQPLVNG